MRYVARSCVGCEGPRDVRTRRGSGGVARGTPQRSRRRPRYHTRERQVGAEAGECQR